MVGITRKYTAYLLRCYIIKSVHPCTLLMASFGKAETSLLFNTSGIRANVEAALPLQLASFAEWQNVATENAQRNRTATDGGGLRKSEICVMQIS